MDGSVTIYHLDLNCANDDNNNSNVSDESFDHHDEDCQKEFDNDKTEMKILQP